MIDMQAFHKWLLSTENAHDTDQHPLAQLTRANRTKIINAQSDLTWVIWHNTPATSAQ